jgi:hypothetical protein
MAMSIRQYPAVIETPLGTVTNSRQAWCVFDDETNHIFAYCIAEEDAKRIVGALDAPAPAPVVPVVHLHIDERELAQAVIPHLHAAIRNATGSRNL